MRLRRRSREQRGFRYSAWDGTQRGFDLDADALLDEMTDDLLYHGDLHASLRRLMQQGMQDRNGEDLMGLRDMLQKLRERRIGDAATLLDGARRAMRASFQREMDAVETHLSFLASVGSVSPYVGLFGTVWGIMHAFTGLGALQQVTLATVAPGIAEALVATALGLFAAIPAVVAYNRFARDIDRVAIQMETFIEEFSNILQRNLGAQSASGH